MIIRCLIILLTASCFGGCTATNLVTPSLQVGSSTVTLVTDFSLADQFSSTLAAADTAEMEHAIGLQSTLRF